MQRAEFEQLIAEEFPKAVPEKFRNMVKNVAFLVEEEPSREVLREEGLITGETLLGLYRGVPHVQRGDQYGVGATLPDVIILFRLPIHDEAQSFVDEGMCQTFDEGLHKAVHDTIWHEVAHYLGFGEDAVRLREEERQESTPLTTIPPSVDMSASEDITHETSSEDILELLPKTSSSPFLVDKSPHSSLDPIEVETEDPEMIKKLHKPLFPGLPNFSSVDPEGGGNGMKSWWEDKEPDEPEIVRPGVPHEPKRGEPPANLPTFNGEK